MGNVILAAPNWIDADPAYAAVTFSGGQWLPSLPLANLRDPLLVRRARSINCAPSSTRFWVDLGAVRDVRVIAIPFLTASLTCTLRARAFETASEAATLIADTGVKSLYPIVYPHGSLYWGHPSFFTGKMTAEDAAAVRMPFVHVFASIAVARHWLIEIDDSAGGRAYVELPRLFMAPGYQPTYNMAFGATAGIESRTTVQQSWGGAEFFDVQQGRRVVRFDLRYLPRDEALAQVADLQARLGISGQLFLVTDPDDTAHLHRRAFLARMRELRPIEYALALRISAGFDLIEVIA